jgi:L-fuculose-phosphate aldolase
VGKKSVRKALVRAARRMEKRGLSPGTSGNLSVRVGEEVYVTPSGVEPRDLSIDDIVVTDLEGVQREGDLAPSSELPFHTALYRHRANLGAVVHTHSRFATILACTRRGIPSLHYMVAGAGTFEIPCAPYATFGTEALSDAIVTTIGGGNACLLANHGQVALGKDLRAALNLAELVERLAETHWGTLAIGGPTLLDDTQMRDVVARFLAGYGSSGRHPVESDAQKEGEAA